MGEFNTPLFEYEFTLSYNISHSDWYKDISHLIGKFNTPLFEYEFTLSYNISHSDWYKDISHLIGKVKLKFQQDFQSRDTAQTLVRHT